jgi:hypothetical protein
MNSVSSGIQRTSYPRGNARDFYSGGALKTEGLRGCLQSVQENSGSEAQLDHDRFFPKVFPNSSLMYRAIIRRYVVSMPKKRR